MTQLSGESNTMAATAGTDDIDTLDGAVGTVGVGQAEVEVFWFPPSGSQ